MDETVYTKITNTAIPAKDRWTNELYKREYLRWWRHNVKGLKRRPTKNDDGTMYKDTHPECKYMDYHKPTAIWKCEVCETSMTEGMKKRHLVSKRHETNTLRKQLISAPATPFVSKDIFTQRNPLQSVNTIIQSAQEAVFFKKNE